MTENLVISLVSNKIVPIIEMVQGDTRELSVVLPEMEDMNYTGCQMGVQVGDEIKIVDGEKKQEQSHTRYVFTADENITNTIGKHKFQFYFYSDEQKKQRISSFPYIINITERTGTNE